MEHIYISIPEYPVAGISLKQLDQIESLRKSPRKMIMWMWCIVRPSIVVIAVLGLITLIYSNIYLYNNCQSAPFLYITVHDMIHNVLKYSRDGCLLESNVLSGGPLSHAELRGLKIGPYNGEYNSLYVADASTGMSQILVYGPCNSQGVRPYRATVVTSASNGGADHSYGLAFDAAGNLYVSFQHTDVVLGFRKDTFRPIPLPQAYNYRDGSYFEGTFFQYGNPGEHPDSEQGIRGISVVDGKNMWIANEDTNSIHIVDFSGKILNAIEIDCPVGIYFDNYFGMVFIGSKSKFGAVYGVNPNNLKIEKVYYIDGMQHPAGLATYGNILYVVEQKMRKVLTFDISTEKFITVIIDQTPGDPEQIEFSQC